jgi:threonine synthase
LFTKLWQGFEQLVRVGLVQGTMPRLHGGQAAGCSPVAAAFAEERAVAPVRPQTIAHSLAIGAPADGDLAVATARASGGAIHSVPEDEVGENMKALAATSGIFAETATGVALGALRAAVARGQIGADDRVVLLVTGSGLKTPDAVGVSTSREIDADVDDLLAELEVAA